MSDENQAWNTIRELDGKIDNLYDKLHNLDKKVDKGINDIEKQLAVYQAYAKVITIITGTVTSILGFLIAKFDIIRTIIKNLVGVN